MNKITKEQLLSCTGLTVKKLKKFIEDNNVPDDALVMIERVKDVYYEKNNVGVDCSSGGQTIGQSSGWPVYLKEGNQYHYCLLENKKIREGYYFNKEEFPFLEEGSELLNELSEEELEEAKNQYHPAWSCVKYNDDNDLLFIDLHY